MSEEYDDADFLAAASAVERTANPRGNAGENSTSDGRVVQPKPQTLPSRKGPAAILVSTRQKGNPILNHVKSLPWEYSDTPCDYVLGATTCALFLSLKYHRLHPEYIYSRIRQLGKLYNLRILLTMVDITNHEEALKELTKTSMINNLTLILCWSAQEAGRYLELFKSYEHASPSSIRAHQAESYRESLTEFVTTSRNINKTDAASLISNFGSLRAAINAEPEELALVPGWGEKKVKAWYTNVREPFRVKRAAKANALLLRQESTMTDVTSGRSITPDIPGRSISAIPISSIPSLSREATMHNASREHPRPESSHKRRKMDAITFDDLDEEEETALISAAERESSLADAEKPKIVQAVKQNQPELSEGVMAALTKLRESS